MQTESNCFKNLCTYVHDNTRSLRKQAYLFISGFYIIIRIKRGGGWTCVRVHPLLWISSWLFISLDILLGLEPRTPLYVTWIFTCLSPVACVPFIKGIEPTQDRTHVLYLLSYNIFKKTPEFFKKKYNTYVLILLWLYILCIIIKIYK